MRWIALGLLFLSGCACDKVSVNVSHQIEINSTTCSTTMEWKR